MRYLNTVIVLGLLVLSCANAMGQKGGKLKAGSVVEVPLRFEEKKGKYQNSSGALQPKTADSTNSFYKKDLGELHGIPDSFGTNCREYHEFDGYQSYHQNKIAGNYPEKLIKYWESLSNWNPDTSLLVDRHVHCYVNFATKYSRDGQSIYVLVDTDMDHDVSDEKMLVLTNERRKQSMLVRFERVKAGKVVIQDSIVMNINYMPAIETKTFKKPLVLGYSYQRQAIAEFTTRSRKGKIKSHPIIVSSMFMNQSYSSIILASDTAVGTSKNLCRIGKYITIDGKVYKHLGVDMNKEVLKLEVIDKTPKELKSAQVGYRPPIFEGKEFTSGKILNLDKYKGKYVYVDFWGTWCGPCLMQMPDLIAAYNKLDKSKIEFIGLVCSDDSTSLNKALLRHGINFPQILDNDERQIETAWGISSYPSRFLIDPKGMVVDVDLRGDKMLEILQGYIDKM